jgi:hypothetical protein
MSKRLENCPKCLTADHLIVDDSLRYASGYEVWCRECGLYGPKGETEESARHKWNKKYRPLTEGIAIDPLCIVWSD